MSLDVRLPLRLSVTLTVQEHHANDQHHFTVSEYGPVVLVLLSSLPS